MKSSERPSDFDKQNTQVKEAPDANVARFQQALTRVCERFPAVAEQIRRSLNTPQLGDYHNEGKTMESHLQLVLATLRDVAQGRFHPSLSESPEVRELMQAGAVEEHPEQPGEQRIKAALVDYVFFHDISKPDCLTLIFDDQSKQEVSWEEWQTIASGGEPFKVGEKTVESISYYHDSKGEAGKHGSEGAEVLKAQAGIAPEVLEAISQHEIAYQFYSVSAAAFEEHFIRPGYSEVQQQFILIAAYIDTMGSLRRDGQPDVTNFLNLVRSRENYLAIKKFLDTLASGTKLNQNRLSVLRRSPDPIKPEDLDAIIIREKQYDVSKLEAGLQQLVASGATTTEKAQIVLDLVREGRSLEIGRTLKKDANIFKGVLAESELKS